jgi:hypothetical protein
MIQKGADVNHPDKHQLAPIHKLVLILVLILKRIFF